LSERIVFSSPLSSFSHYTPVGGLDQTFLQSRPVGESISEILLFWIPDIFPLRLDRSPERDDVKPAIADFIVKNIVVLYGTVKMIQDKWKVLITIAVTTMTATMDASITNIAFPALTQVFETDVSVVMWVTVVFILVSTSSMLIIGKISDMVGRKRIFLAGIVVFTLALLACSLAGSIGQLIFFRALQGVGAAMTISCGTAIVTEVFPPHEMGKGLGSLGVSVSLGFIAGPIIGGVLLDFLDWRSIFYMRVPLGIAAFVMAIIFLSEDHADPGKIRLDLLGALTSSAGIFLFVFGISQMREYGFASLRVLPIAGLGLAFIMVFVFIERRAQNPIVDPALFKDRVFSSAMGGLFLHFVAAPPYMLIIPFYLMIGLHLRASEAGLLMAATSVTTMVFGPVSGWLSDRFGPVWFAAIGAAVATMSFVFMLGFDLQSAARTITPVFVLLGVGVGTFQPANNSIIMSAVSRKRLGTASALIATQRQVGIAVGMAVSGTLYSSWRDRYQEEFVQQGFSGAYASEMAIPLAFHDVLLISIVINAVVAVLSLLPLWTRRKNP
jgi:EmrB/QacA subfamily drug resistance transporter